MNIRRGDIFGPKSMEQVTCNNVDCVRKPHVIADRSSRVLKAKKIIAIVGQEHFLKCQHILEVGCGSGIISNTLSKVGNSAQQFDAVDVIDSRTEPLGYRFQLVSGTSLPFEDGSFDLVITNQVIEHVGDEPEQLHHLCEIRRVIRHDGLVYFAAPNKWRVIEPHYHLPLLSWLPRRASDRYLHVARRESHYDCYPRSLAHFKRLFAAAGFAYHDRTLQALREMLRLELPNSIVTRAADSVLPDWFLRLGMPIMPIFVFLLRPIRQ